MVLNSVTQQAINGQMFVFEKINKLLNSGVLFDQETGKIKLG